MVNKILSKRVQCLKDVIRVVNINYDLRYVAFLDLMGFRNMVDQSTIDADILNTINQALDYTGYVQYNNYHGTFSLVELGKQVTSFSDSVVISYNASMPGGGFYVLIDIVHICINLLGLGIPVRGGVTVGKLIHTERKCFGPAMVRAYLMESQKAKFPRVLIDSEVMKHDLENPGAANTVEYEADYLSQIVQKDAIDNYYFLDYLKQYEEFDEFESYIDYMLGIKEFIIRKLSIYQLSTHKEDEEIYMKYVWLKNYYNKTIEAVLAEPKQFLIP